MKMEELDTTRKVMNKIMMNYIEQVRSEPNMYIKERSPFERLVEKSPFPPVTGGNRDNTFPLMFKDKWNSFSNVFLSGRDWDFLMLYSCVLSFLE